MTHAITVLLPVRGDATFLAQALDSLRAQVFEGWQAAVLAFGDAASQLSTALARDDPRFHVTMASGNQTHALAAAAASCESEFICVVDGDDVLEPQAFSLLLQALAASPETGMAYSRHVLVDAHDHRLGPGPLCELPYSADALLLDFMIGPLRLMRTSVFRDAGGYAACSDDAADYDLCLRLSEITRIMPVPQPLYRRRIHPDAPEVKRWAEAIEARYAAFARAVKRRGLDAKFDCALEIDSWHILQPLQPFGGIGILR